MILAQAFLNISYFASDVVKNMKTGEIPYVMNLLHAWGWATYSTLFLDFITWHVYNVDICIAAAKVACVYIYKMGKACL